MVIQKNQSTKFIIPGGTAGLLYPSVNNDFTIATVKMNGIYPEKGISINDYCTETIFLLDGELEVIINGQKHKLLPGDCAVIRPGNEYKVIGKGRSIDFITPAWDKKQNHIII